MYLACLQCQLNIVPMWPGPAVITFNRLKKASQGLFSVKNPSSFSSKIPISLTSIGDSY